MKYLILLLLLVAPLAVAGPAVDRARDAMSAIQGSQVTNARGLEVIQAWVVIDEVRTVPVTQCVTDPDQSRVCHAESGDPAPCQICTTTHVVDPYTNEEMAQMWLDKMKMFNVRRVNQFRDTIKDEELKAQRDALDAIRSANRIVDL